MAFFFWTGTETFLMKEKRDFWIAEFEKKHNSINIATLDAEELTSDEIDAHINTLPFLGEKRLVFISNLPPASTKSIDAKSASIIIESLKSLSDTIVLVLISSKPDKRTSLYKFIAENAQTEEFVFPKKLQLEEFVQKRAQQHGTSFLPSAIPFFLEKVNEDLWKIENEIAKLANFTNDKKMISENDIEKLVIQEVNSNVFTFIEAVFEKKKEKALKELSHLMQEGESLMQVLALLGRQLRHISLIHSLPKSSKQELARELGVPPFTVDKLIKQSLAFPHEKIVSLYKKCIDIDFSLKTGKISISTHNESALALEIEKCILAL